MRTIRAPKFRLMLVVAAVLALAASACEYDPAAFAGNAALSECLGVPATMAVGWAEDLDGPAGAVHYGTEEDDVVVITNGPVTFHAGGGNDLICLNETGVAWGSESAVVHITTGGGNNIIRNASTRLGPALRVEMHDGTDWFAGGPADESVVVTDYNNTRGAPDWIYTGGGDDDIWLTRGGHAEVVDCGEGHDVLSTGGDWARGGHADEVLNCEVLPLPPVAP